MILTNNMDTIHIDNLPFPMGHGKHQRHFKHGSTYLPELLTNEGETYFTTFCTHISKICGWYETPEIEFKLGMNIIFKDGTGKSKHVVYKGATASGLKQVIRRIDGSWSHIDQSHLSFINQIGFENIPQAPLDYCQEVGIGISQEQAQRLACPRTLTPHQQELMSLHHCLYHLSFNRILMLAKHGYLPKILLKLQDELPLCVACQFGTAIATHGKLRERKVALFENRIKQNRVMEYQLIKSYQLNQA